MFRKLLLYVLSSVMMPSVVAAQNHSIFAVQRLGSKPRPAPAISRFGTEFRIAERPKSP